MMNDQADTRMNDEEEPSYEEPRENKSFSAIALNRIVAILFVLGIYLIIFLKMLVLE
jgi:hypothetical protein